MKKLTLQHISYSYNGKDKILDDVNFTFDDHKIYAIIGKSGAGKTTLLSLLSQLTSPSEGAILYEDKDIKSIDQYRYRSQYLGVIFQSFNLLPHLSALENVVLSMEIAHMKNANNKQSALALLESVGLSKEEANRRVLKLSGGQQQRVAIARALSYDPDIILADEPTGNLDQETQEEIMAIFSQLAYDKGKCIILVTHSPAVAQKADVVYELKKVGKSRKEKDADKKIVKQKQVCR